MKKINIILIVFLLFTALNTEAKQEVNNPSSVGNSDSNATTQTGKNINSNSTKNLLENKTQNELEAKDNLEANDNQSGQQNQNQEATQAQIQNQGEQDSIQSQLQNRAQNFEELKNIIQKNKKDLEDEANSKKNKIKKVYQNQNQVREAVHAMLAMEDLLGGVGKNVSEIAQDFNNSVEKTIQAEEKIQNRNFLVKFFLGGNQEAADEIDSTIKENQEKLKKLNQLYKNCDCEKEIRQIFQEQIQNIESEQERLQNLVVKEKNNKGLIGTILSWFK